MDVKAFEGPIGDNETILGSVLAKDLRTQEWPGLIPFLIGGMNLSKGVLNSTGTGKTGGRTCSRVMLPSPIRVKKGDGDDHLLGPPARRL